MGWTIDDSKAIHGIGSGDMDFLDIDKEGNLVITIEDQTITVKEILDRLRNDYDITNGHKLPSFTLRLPQLIGKQIEKILTAFDQAFQKYAYKGTFDPLYPIKVNQQKQEINTVVESSPKYGLEAGTKAELFLILQQLKDQKNRTIVCNGVKDHEYIGIINQALRDGYTVFVSIESVEELVICTDHIDLNNLNLIFRMKPYVKIAGYWGSTSGRNSKFGLSIDDLMQAIAFLEKNNQKRLLRGIHAHPGSQISDFPSLTRYIKFLVATFEQLHLQGFENLNIIDFGGGMPIRYESENNVRLIFEYADAIVQNVVEMCVRRNIDHPSIMTESGRFITASSSMAIIQVLNYYELFPKGKEKQQEIKKKIQEKVHSVEDAENFWKELDSKNYADTDFAKLHDFETSYGVAKEELRKHLMKYGSKMLSNEILKRIYTANYLLLGNFSIFNSACDHVMVGQYFPVFEVENLHLQPDTLSRLVDITCDSDGEISIFRLKKHDKDLFTKDGFPLTSADQHYIKGFPTTMNTNVRSKYIAIPLIGAYQDIIELDHNLIGDLPDVQILLKDDKTWEVEVTTHAQPIYDLLKRVGYHLDIDKTSYIT